MMIKVFSKLTLFTLFCLTLSLLLAACGESSPTAAINPTTAATTQPVPATNVAVSSTAPPQPTAVATPALPTVTPLPATTAPLPSPSIVATTGPTATPLPAFTTPAQAGITLPAKAAGPVGGPTLKRDFMAEAAFAHVKELAGTIGIRAAGTDGERKAGDYIENYFKDLGLFTERPSFEAQETSDAGSTVTYTDGTGNQVGLKAEALNLSGSGKVEGQLKDVGLALPGENVAGLRGKVALVQRGQATFQQKVDLALSSGATAVLIYNNQAGLLNGATLVNKANIPVLGLSQADGERLKQDLAARNPTVLVNGNIITKQITIQNVVGRRNAFRGDPAIAPILIIGGHYDSVPAGPGANDNASGTAITLEMARVLQGRYPNFELRFVAFSGEEIGLLGSQNYAQNLSQTERKRIKAMINVDMVTVGNDFYVGGSPDLVKIGLTAAVNAGAGNVQVVPASLAGSSDHASFEAIGVPVLFFNRESDPNYHQPGDTFDQVKPDRLLQVGRTVTQIIDVLART